MGKVEPTVRVVSAEIHRDGRYLITQRSARAVLPLLWEFPGGRVRDEETDAQALVRAVKHRIGVDVTVRERVLEVRHAYPEYTVFLAVYACEIAAGEPFAHAVNALAWVAPDEFGDYPFPGADQKTVDALLNDAAG
ncbi:MAG: (deoxy)nucleoside triphosphate pyrophosphohydrolase [Myxococcota bacterium]